MVRRERWTSSHLNQIVKLDPRLRSKSGSEGGSHSRGILSALGREFEVADRGEVHGLNDGGGIKVTTISY